jgi:nitroreductase
MQESQAMSAPTSATTAFTGDAVRRALEVARFAPSAHNTQPWRVALDAGRLVIGVDPRRHLAHSDPLERDLRLAMGGFVDAVTMALRSEGVGAALVEGPPGAFATLAPDGAVDRGQAAKAVSLLRRRQTSRLAYSPRAIEPATLEALATAARSNGLLLHAVPRGTSERAKIDGWFFAAAREAWLDPRAVAELRRWVRLDPEGARAPADGLSTHCLGLGTREALAMRVALADAPWRAAAAAFLAPTLAEALAETEARDVSRAPFLALLVTDQGRAAAAGAGLLRTWLAATELGLALHPISVLLDRRGWEVARHLGVKTEQLAFACRLGRSAPPPRAGRLPVDRFAKV